MIGKKVLFFGNRCSVVHNHLYVFVICVVWLLFMGQNSWALAISDADLKKLQQQYERPTEIPFPEDRPYTKEKFELGKKLFFDPRISGTGITSCSSCHNPLLGWADGLPLTVGTGHRILKRRSMTILNLAWDLETESYFWDGRVPSLEDQIKALFKETIEMDILDTELVFKLQEIKGYPPLFQKAFPQAAKPITIDNIATAIATFERTVVSGEAPFDRWINGDEGAISETAKRGFVLFNGKANCSDCHSSWRFSDGSSQDIGIGDTDLGRGAKVPVPSLLHAFKVVGLRDIEKRSPYMHNGSLKTLMEVVDFYNDGFTRRESLSDLIKPLDLAQQEKEDLVEFLKTLSEYSRPFSYPELPLAN